MRLTKQRLLLWNAGVVLMCTVSLDQDRQDCRPAEKEPLPTKGTTGFPTGRPTETPGHVANKPAVVDASFAHGRGSRDMVVCIYSAGTGEVREYPGVRAFSTRWSADGRSLYVTATNVGGGGIYRIDVESGTVTPVVPKARGLGVEISADGQWLVFCRAKRMLRQTSRAGEKEVGSADVAPPDLSRDGSRLAWVAGSDERRGS
jgi:Tol biopolymer transport system component